MVGEHLSQAEKMTEMGLTVDVLSGEVTPEERDAAFAKCNAGETIIFLVRHNLLCYPPCLLRVLCLRSNSRLSCAHRTDVPRCSAAGSTPR